jgi:iron complex outermembrane receptor protein
VRIGPNSVMSSIPAGANARPAPNASPNPATCPVNERCPDQVIIDLPVTIIENTEIGLRSDWLDSRLRFNATYFDSDWDGMGIDLLPTDALGNTQPFPYQTREGKGISRGWEFEVVWAPTERLMLNAGVGLIDTTYIQRGLLTGAPGQASITGNFPGAPFAYAADESGALGATYDLPLSNGGHMLLVGNYGWTGDYARDAAYQRTQIDPNGNPVLEPGYGILNARFVYEPSDRRYSIEVWGKNLLNELYINGGFDTRDTWGYDFSIVGRAREVGVGLSFSF